MRMDLELIFINQPLAFFLIHTSIAEISVDCNVIHTIYQEQGYPIKVFGNLPIIHSPMKIKTDAQCTKLKLHISAIHTCQHKNVK